VLRGGDRGGWRLLAVVEVVREIGVGFLNFFSFQIVQFKRSLYFLVYK